MPLTGRLLSSLQLLKLMFQLCLHALQAFLRLKHLLQPPAPTSLTAPSSAAPDAVTAAARRRQPGCELGLHHFEHQDCHTVCVYMNK